MLVPKQRVRLNGESVYPDGTLRDLFNLPRGYWEAKDTDDDLEEEVRAKIEKGYPLVNTIFEYTQQAILYQGKRERARYDLTRARDLADLLNDFYAYTEPDIQSFGRAVEEFKDRVPELAQALNEKVKEAHQSNAKFQAAFAEFFSICQAALNPNISCAAVDEMLVQHLLTERLFRTVFDDLDFTRRNAIAAHVEKVIAALVSKSFRRTDFLKSLDKFYRAIEDAAQGLDDHTEKQAFLNAVYERFFQGYSTKVADTHGIVYTPQAIVDFMCGSVAEVLETEFGKRLGDPGVNILDPCTGTGNFIVNLLHRIPKKDLPRMYREQLFANEVMLLPYYIAALNIEHTYDQLTGGEYEPFEGLCFVDTLDLVEGAQRRFPFMNEANTNRVERQKKAPITIIIGNPPYNMGQLNENDNNRNRKYPVIDKRIAETYVKDSVATLRRQLYDPYVRFFRWAADRLEGDGIVCLVTNNSFVDQIAYDGMRKHLLRDFTRIYHLHLEGNVRRNPTLSGTAYNVFGVQVGVGITVAVRTEKHSDHCLFFQRLEKTLRREAKLVCLSNSGSIGGIEWQTLVPDSRNTWLVPENTEEYAAFIPIGSKAAKIDSQADVAAVFKSYGRGVATNADSYVYDFDCTTLVSRAKEMVEDFNSEVDRWKRSGRPKELNGFLRINETIHKWIRNTKRTLLRGNYVLYEEASIRTALYRPFTERSYFFERAFNEDTYQFPRIFPTPATERENRLIALTAIGSEKPFMLLASTRITDMHLVGAGASCQCFPFYVYDEGGSNRRENITDWALKQFRTHYGDKRIDKWDIFHYVYGLLHHPGYRERFADNLKRELPRIPFAPDFRAFAAAGQELARLHLDYEKLESHDLEWRETSGVPLSYQVKDKMRLSKDKTALVVNPSLTLAGIPPETFQYRLGNRSALEWVIDQYQVSEDQRSGIRADPNRTDDPEYIVRLVGQVVQLSLKTAAIIDQLPEQFM